MFVYKNKHLSTSFSFPFVESVVRSAHIYSKTQACKKCEDKTPYTNHRSVGIQKWDGGRHVGAERVFSTQLAPSAPSSSFSSLNIQKVHSSTSTKYLKKKKGGGGFWIETPQVRDVLCALCKRRAPRPAVYSIVWCFWRGITSGQFSLCTSRILSSNAKSRGMMQ